MGSKVDYKNKYIQLRSKYLNAIDVAFRLGVQEGARQGELQNMQQQLQQQQQQAQMQQQMQQAPGAAQMGQEMPQDGSQGEAAPQEMGGNPEDQGAAQMPGQDGGAAPIPGQDQQAGAPADDLDLSMQELESYLKSEKPDLNNLMKSFHKVKETKKVNDEKRVIAKNRQIVDGILKSWDEKEKEASKKLANIIK